MTSALSELVLEFDGPAGLLVVLKHQMEGRPQSCRISHQGGVGDLHFVTSSPGDYG